MDENCMVLSGDWVCGDVGTWDFVIEKNRMGRMELEGNVLREFKLDEGRFHVSLSYWPPTSFELATGIRTPPVLITNEGAVKYFCQHQKVKGGMNLFAKFELKTDNVDNEVVDDSGMGYVSPEAARFVEKRDLGCGSSKKGYLSSAASKTRVIDIADDSRLGFVSPEASRFGGRSDLGCGSSKNGYVSSPYKKSRVIDIADDDELVREVEKLEEKIMSEGVKGGSSKGEDESGFSLVTYEEENFEMDEISVRPRGYEKEFRSPLLARDFRGSAAVNIVYNEDEIVEGLTKKKGPRTYFCDTQSCFDHYVGVGGGVINPHGDARDVDIPEEVSSQVVYPPNTKRQPGRRRKTRIPSTGEIRTPKKKVSKNRCDRCREEGHNRTNCTVPI
ncbi:hypothetical protein HID58_060906 [Brassica napus]|uniref:Uncharacterized protein n=1 Tax=Brassica napus TaxID=3708 RepID=A0ABQ7ZX41_BRANA|nr:hypothetical protein HID58_060906 [Brassica napus]